MFETKNVFWGAGLVVLAAVIALAINRSIPLPKEMEFEGNSEVIAKCIGELFGGSEVTKAPLRYLQSHKKLTKNRGVDVWVVSVEDFVGRHWYGWRVAIHETQPALVVVKDLSETGMFGTYELGRWSWLKVAWCGYVDPMI